MVFILFYSFAEALSLYFVHFLISSRVLSSAKPIIFYTQSA